MASSRRIQLVFYHFGVPIITLLSSMWFLLGFASLGLSVSRASPHPLIIPRVARGPLRKSNLKFIQSSNSRRSIAMRWMTAVAPSMERARSGGGLLQTWCRQLIEEVATYVHAGVATHDKRRMVEFAAGALRLGVNEASLDWQIRHHCKAQGCARSWENGWRVTPTVSPHHLPRRDVQ